MRDRMEQIGVAVVGAGPWGGTLARTFARVPGADLRWICELDDGRRAEAQRAHPGARVTRAIEEALSDPAVSAAVVAVDPPRHHAVGLHVLSADRHLLVEKPMATSVADAVSLCGVAVARRRVLTVGHLLLHHPALHRTKRLLDDGKLGQPLYFESTRTARSGGRRGSAWWTLAPHDVSTAIFLFDASPVAVSAAGVRQPDLDHDVAAFATLHFADGRLAHVHAARAAAPAQRRYSVMGTRCGVTFDELAADPVLLLSDGGGRTAGESIRVEVADPLFSQCLHFTSAVARGDTSGGNGSHALAVVRVLEAGARSMAANGTPVPVV